MSRRTETIGQTWFDDLYAREADPWGFTSSDYERRKYIETLKALPNEFYARAFEVGCSIGVLTHQLASRCGRLLAVDVAAKALGEARRHCQDLGNVEFQQMFVPRQWPDGAFDLILLSEVAYYLDANDVAVLAKRVASSIAPRGAIVMAHWIGETDYPLTGDEATERFIAELGDLVDVRSRDRWPKYRLDVLVRRGERLQPSQ